MKYFRSLIQHEKVLEGQRFEDKHRLTSFANFANRKMKTMKFETLPTTLKITNIVTNKWMNVIHIYAKLTIELYDNVNIKLTLHS